MRTDVPCSLREFRPTKEEKETIDSFTAFFVGLDPANLNEIIATNMDLLVQM